MQSLFLEEQNREPVTARLAHGPLSSCVSASEIVGRLLPVRRRCILGNGCCRQWAVIAGGLGGGGVTSLQWRSTTSRSVSTSVGLFSPSAVRLITGACDFAAASSSESAFSGKVIKGRWGEKRIAALRRCYCEPSATGEGASSFRERLIQNHHFLLGAPGENRRGGNTAGLRA